MRANQEFIKQLEELYQNDKQEVKKNISNKNTTDTYLGHSWRFIRWCKNDFEPGINLKNK